MKFRSPGEQAIQVSLTSGHTLVIPPEGVTVPVMFRKEAIAIGAEPMAPDSNERMVPQDESGLAGAEGVQARTVLIKDALRAMLDGSDESDFTADGKPNLLKLKARAGFNVPRNEADAAWEELQAEEAEKAK